MKSFGAAAAEAGRYPDLVQLHMTTRRSLFFLAGVAGLVLVGLAVAGSQLPAIGAGGLLHPARRPVTQSAPKGCEGVTFRGEGLDLKGWRCRASTARRGTVVYLHGIADNRTSAVGVVDRFVKRGFDVVAYDSRAHGESAGEACTYGFFEKLDLRRVLDTVEAGPVILVGTSLGAAVALQTAALDQRVSAVVAAESFSDLRTIATERAPFVFTAGLIARAFQLAEQQARFSVDDVSPVAASADIKIPVLLVHGADDADTPPAHSQRLVAALAGPKRLILVPGGKHNTSLGGAVWSEIEQWLESAIATAPG